MVLPCTVSGLPLADSRPAGDRPVHSADADSCCKGCSHLEHSILTSDYQIPQLTNGRLQNLVINTKLR